MAEDRPQGGPRHATCARTRALALGWALALGACDRCGEQPQARVPFKLGTQEAEADAGADDAGKVTPTADTATHTPAVDHPQVDGKPLPLAKVRATLALDLDADGDRDAVAIVEPEPGRAQLLVSLAEAAGFQPPREAQELTHGPAGASCVLGIAELEAVSATKAVAVTQLGCGTPSVLQPLSYTLLALEAAPRLYDRLGLPADASQPFLAATPSSLDADGDGHDDLALSLSLVGRPVEESGLKLVWLDRPSGLVRDVREPHATLSAQASAAQKLASEAPEQAIARAQGVLTLWRAVCRESGEAVVTLSDSAGIPCGEGKSASAALLALVLAHAKTGHVRQAFDAYRELGRDGRSLDARGLERANKALAGLSAEAGVTLRRGPSVEPVKAPRVHLPSARFVSENTLYVSRREPVLYNLETSEESEVSIPSDALMRDPGGRLAITAVERSCAGYGLRIERAGAGGADYVPSPPVSTPLAWPRAGAPGCTSLPESLRADDGGLRVLGWAPQGVVAVRGSEVRVVPLTLDGRAAGGPRLLASAAPRPAPLPSGAATPDGARYVELTPFGILVFGPDTEHVELWRPQGYAAIGAQGREAALSPSGRRVAVIADGSVYVLERGAR